jgi:hypothetical protein
MVKDEEIHFKVYFYEYKTLFILNVGFVVFSILILIILTVRRFAIKFGQGHQTKKSPIAQIQFLRIVQNLTYFKSL